MPGEQCRIVDSGLKVPQSTVRSRTHALCLEFDEDVIGLKSIYMPLNDFAARATAASPDLDLGKSPLSLLPSDLIIF